MNWRDKYSELLHASAEKWGLAVVEGRPYIDDHTNPYPRPTVHETLRWQNGKFVYVEVELFIFNGQWGYCMNVQFSGGGWCYGPFLKFCNPHSTRTAALKAAFLELQGDVDEGRNAGERFREASAALHWLEKLSQPEQLTLF